jgi:hypothetical protein
MTSDQLLTAVPAQPAAAVPTLRAAVAGLPTYTLDLVVLIPPQETVESIELVTLSDSLTILAQWDRSTTPIDSTAISSVSKTESAGANEHRTQEAASLVRVTVALSDARTSDPANSMVYLKNRAGVTIAEARFVEK